ncbi:MAG TPA: hypothetical protein VF290_27105 [Pyrinomonadaceae bacterium]
MRDERGDGQLAVASFSITNMKLLVIVAVILLTFSSIAVQPGKRTIVLEQEFRLKIGESAKASSEGLQVEFDSVAEDSRCPKDVNCIWAGNAKILLKVRKDAAEAASVELNTNMTPKTSRYLEYELRLKDLKPYPESKAAIKSSEYEVTLTVHKI